MDLSLAYAVPMTDPLNSPLDSVSRHIKNACSPVPHLAPYDDNLHNPGALLQALWD